MVPRLYSGHKLEEAGSKAKRRSGGLLVDKAALTSLPTIEERLCKAARQTTLPRGEEQAHNCSTSMFLLQCSTRVVREAS